MKESAPSLLSWLRHVLRAEDMPLRPPGARPEAEFVALCIRCNRCVEICPYDALEPAGLAYGLDAQTPLLVARRTPCYLCMECPPVCPTGALNPDLRRSEDVRMGRAVVDDTTCYAHMGILCRTCVDDCPLEERAIHQDGELRPVVTEHCVGCGICERVCPAPDAAIRVVPAGAGI